MRFSRITAGLGLALLLGASVVGADDVFKKPADTCSNHGTFDRFLRHAVRSRAPGSQGRKTRLCFTCLRELRRPSLHLKQRRSAPCERFDG